MLGKLQKVVNTSIPLLALSLLSLSPVPRQAESLSSVLLPFPPLPGPINPLTWSNDWFLPSSTLHTPRYRWQLRVLACCHYPHSLSCELPILDQSIIDRLTVTSLHHGYSAYPHRLVGTGLHQPLGYKVTMRGRPASSILLYSTCCGNVMCSNRHLRYTVEPSK